MVNIKEITVALEDILDATTKFINSLRTIKDNIASDGAKPEEPKSVESPAKKKRNNS